jgi:hypothetical protein
MVTKALPKTDRDSGCLGPFDPETRHRSRRRKGLNLTARITEGMEARQGENPAKAGFSEADNPAP